MHPTVGDIFLLSSVISSGFLVAKPFGLENSCQQLEGAALLISRYSQGILAKKMWRNRWRAAKRCNQGKPQWRLKKEKGSKRMTE